MSFPSYEANVLPKCAREAEDADRIAMRFGYRSNVSPTKDTFWSVAQSSSGSAETNSGG